MRRACPLPDPAAATRRRRAVAGPTSALALAVLAGCTTMAPEYERPAAPVAPAFPAIAAPPTGPLAAETPWESYFVDPTLHELIGLALAHNRDLRIAALNIEAVRAQYDLRRADQWPTINAAFAATRQTGPNGQTVDTYTAGFALASYEIDLFGRLRSLTDAAASALLASEEARSAAQISLVATVANQYLALAASDDLLALARSTLGSREQSLRLTQLRLDNGVASELELRQAQSLVEGARAALAQARRQRELDRNALALLVGQPLPPLPDAPGRLAALVLPDVAGGLPSEVLLERPDVRQAERLLQGANANIGAARAAFWPRITLTAGVGTASTALGDLFTDGAWSFAVQLLQPIFDAGRNRANLAGAEVQRDIAVAAYERAIQAAFRDVADALAARATLDEQLRATQAQVAAEQARVDLTLLRFRSGVAASFEVLDAERSLFAFQVLEVQTRLAMQQSRVALYRALGGGLSEEALGPSAAAPATPARP